VVGEVRRLADAGVEPSIRLSKGVHVLLSADTAWSAALTIPHDKVRVSFAVPWEGMLLLGTTDTLHEGDPGAVVTEPTDIERSSGACTRPNLIRIPAPAATT
jgi:glycerol-3-phosphate dehydrogenase